MEFWKDWRFWAFIVTLLNLVGIIGIGVFNKLMHDKLVSNDLFHLSKSVEEVKTEQICIKKEVISLGKEVKYIKGKVDL